jgi:alanine racemase
VVAQSISEIAQLCNGEWISQGAETPIYEIATDSRKVTEQQASSLLFIAFAGHNHDAHQYIHELYKQGVRNFLVEKKIEALPEANIIWVNSTLQALQRIAAAHRKKFHLPVIGITGSNGKTIVKEWLFTLLKNDFRIVRSPGSYNSQLGTALSLLQIEKEDGLALIEAGISKPNEMELQAAMIQPDLVVLTHFGSAHDEGFENRTQKLQEKLKLAMGADVLVYGKDDAETEAQVNEFVKNNYIKTISWSRSKHATLQVTDVKKNDTTSKLTIIYKSTPLQLTLPFKDDASIENALTCLCVMLALERVDEDHLASFMHLAPVAMRMQMKEGMNGCIIINDSYSSDLHSLQTALAFLEQQNPRLKKTVILSDLLESGLPHQQLYSKVAALLKQKDIYKFIGVGKEIGEVLQHIQFPLQQVFATTDALINHIDTSTIADEIILVKGARRFAFDKVSSMLEQQVHQTQLHINLDAVVHNLNVYKSKIPRGCKLMAMVKAFSYGSGSYELAKILQHQRVDYLSVAYADEGVALRRAGIQLPIMVMNPEPQSFRQIIDFGLEPEIYSFDLLNQYIQALQQSSKAAPAIHIEFDTGMKRLGFEAVDVDPLLALLLQYPLIRVASVFSHLAASDEAKYDDFTQQQIELFKQITQLFCAAFPYKILRHIANSAGISRFPDAAFDLVRLGLGLQGIDPADTIQDALIPVASLKSVVSQIKYIKQGESIGYSRKAMADKDMRIAIVAIGYADGLNRLLSNRNGKVYIQGKACQIVGNVCMDMCMVDIENEDVKTGDEVIIFNDASSLKAIATACQTIPYEILTSVSGRVKRVYEKE